MGSLGRFNVNVLISAVLIHANGQGCTAFNPGSFCLAGCAFMVYWPSRARLDPAASEENRRLFDTRVEYSTID